MSSSAAGASTTVTSARAAPAHSAQRVGVADVDAHDRSGPDAVGHERGLDRDRQLEHPGLVGRAERRARQQLALADPAQQPGVGRQRLVGGEVEVEVGGVDEPHLAGHEVVAGHLVPGGEVGGGRPHRDGVVGRGEQPRPGDHRDRDDGDADPEAWVAPARPGGAGRGGWRG